jgi:hypothetical protein
MSNLAPAWGRDCCEDEATASLMQAFHDGLGSPLPLTALRPRPQD